MNFIPIEYDIPAVTAFSKPSGLLDGAFGANVPCIQRRGWLKEQDVCFLVGDWAVLDLVWDNDKFTFLEPDVPVAKLHAKSAFDHEKHLVFIVMMVPEELSLKLDQLDELAVELTNNPRAPVVIQEGELCIKLTLSMNEPFRGEVR